MQSFWIQSSRICAGVEVHKKLYFVQTLVFWRKCSYPMPLLYVKKSIKYDFSLSRTWGMRLVTKMYQLQLTPARLDDTNVCQHVQGGWWRNYSQLKCELHDHGSHVLALAKGLVLLWINWTCPGILNVQCGHTVPSLFTEICRLMKP